MSDTILGHIHAIYSIIKDKIMHPETTHAPEEDLKVINTQESGQGDAPSEVRYASIEDAEIKKELSKPVDYSRGAKVVNNGEEVAIFTLERDGKDYVAKAEAFAAEHGYEVAGE